MGFNKVGKHIYIVLSLLAIFLFSCHRHIAQMPPPPKPHPISLKPILNIPFIEVRRRLKSGLSFDDQGFMAEPFYRITFLSTDSARVLNPMDGQYYNFLVFPETDSIINVARSYFKMIKMSRDSMILQVMLVEDDTLHTQRSQVYMTFYAQNYLQNILHTTAATLGRPDHNDTAFILKKSAIANKILDSAFAARQPATLASKNPLAKVELKEVKPDVMNNFDATDAYMNPEFYITIHKAYQDFSYSFTVLVDDKGILHFDKPLEMIDPEFRDATLKVMKGIVDGYLTFYLKVTPGSTLGIKHTSRIIVNVMGQKE